jgi:hypothetical protein
MDAKAEKQDSAADAQLPDMMEGAVCDLLDGLRGLVTLADQDIADNLADADAARASVLFLARATLRRAENLHRAMDGVRPIAERLRLLREPV